MLSRDLLESYRSDGFVLVKGLIPRASTLDALVAIDALLCAREPSLTRSSRASVEEDLHSKIGELAARDRPALAKVYDAIRKISAFWGMVGGEPLLGTAAELLATESVGVAFRGCGIRLDLPNEDRWRSAWHQEYHAQMSSMRALTAWFGLVPVTASMGPVELLPGSHADGLIPVRCPDAMNTRRDYTESFVMPDVEARVARYRKASFETEQGDVLFLDFFTLHQSGYNRDARRSRMTCQVRYFDMLHPSAVAHAWVGGFQDGGDFRKVHPEAVLPEN